jgi:nucleoside 2-deoxyribosyltransferase
VRIYLASRFDRQDELRGYARQLRAAGHVVTARWLKEESDVVLAPTGWTNDPSQLVTFAKNDLADIDDSDMMVVFTHEGLARGGMHVEFGYALALNKRLVVVGPRQTLFHYLPRVTQFETWKEARAYIGKS